MKNKRNTYLLLGVVMIIWGLILYKMIHTLYPREEHSATRVLGVSFKATPIQEQDTFSIAIHERDPFLDVFRPKRIQHKPKRSTSVRIREENVPQLAIAFSGMITDTKSKARIFFVTINGQQHLMKIDEEIADVKLIRGSEDAIRIRHKNKLRTIAISQ